MSAITFDDALARARAGQLLGPEEMIALWRVVPSTYYRMRKQGAFDQFLVRGKVGTRARCYSGVLVARYFDGQAVFEPSFGRRSR